MKAIIILTLVISFGFLNANNIQTVTKWQGDINHFVFNTDGSFASIKDNKSAMKSLSMPHTATQAYSLSASLTLAFNPSNANQIRIYLQSCQADFQSAANAIFLEIGQSGNTDRISVYQRDQDIEKNIFTSPHRIRADDNSFKLAIDFMLTKKSISMTFTFEDKTFINFVDNNIENHLCSFNTQSYAGLTIKYTKSRSDQFFIHHYNISPIKDTQAPILNEINIISITHITLVFDEPILRSTVKKENIYINQKQVQAVNLINSNTLSIALSLPLRFSTHTLSLIGIKDLNGNAVQTQQYPFTHLYQPSLYDIIFSEIMIDPFPVKGLENFEYIELYNTTHYTISLSNWKVRVKGRLSSEIDHSIGPKDFILLVKKGTDTAGMSDSKVIFLDTLPILSNQGFLLELIDQHNRVIDSIPYDLSIYDHSLKSDGGYSLEKRILSFTTQCDESILWSFSEHPDGGTPLFYMNNLPPNPSFRVDKKEDDIFIITFDEAFKLLPSIPNIKLDGVTRTISEVQFDDANNEIYLQLSTPLPNAVLVTFTIADLNFCLYSTPISIEVPIFIPRPIVYRDIYISELLFDPFINGAEFIELYNATSQTWQMNKLSIFILDHQGNTVQEKKIYEGNLTINAFSAYAFTDDKDNILSTYSVYLEPNIISTSLLPQFSNDGRVIQLRYDNIIIDEIAYSQDYFDSFFSNTKGISLVRDFDIDSQWRPSNVGIAKATPGLMMDDKYRAQVQPIELKKRIVYPNSNNPILQVAYNFKHGTMLNVSIFDKQGNFYGKWLDQYYIYGNGILDWNLQTPDFLKLPSNIYLLMFHLSNSQQDVKIIEWFVVLD